MYLVTTVVDSKPQKVDADNYVEAGKFLVFSKENALVTSFVLSNVVEIKEYLAKPPKKRTTFREATAQRNRGR